MTHKIKSIDVHTYTHPELAPWVSVHAFNHDSKIVYHGYHPVTDLPKLQAAQRALMEYGEFEDAHRDDYRTTPEATK